MNGVQWARREASVDRDVQVKVPEATASRRRLHDILRDALLHTELPRATAAKAAAAQGETRRPPLVA